MKKTLQDFTADELCRKIDENFGDFLKFSLADAPGLTWFEGSGALRYTSGMPHPFGNMICGGIFTPEAAEQGITDLMTPIVEMNAPAFWIIGSATQPDDLGDSLADAGLMFATELTGMAVDITSYPYPEMPEGVDVREVLSDAELSDWVDVLSAGYEIPSEVSHLFATYLSLHGCSTSSPVRAFLGYYQDKPVASSMVVGFGDVAGIYCVATIPEARGKGAGGAVTAVAVAVASQLGYNLAILQATHLGYPVYARLGFQDYGKISIYVRPKAEE